MKNFIKQLFEEFDFKKNMNLIIVILSIPVILTFNEYMYLFYNGIMKLLHLNQASHIAPLYPYIYWSCFCITGYIIIPVIILLLLKKNPLLYGFVSSAKGKITDRLKTVMALYLAVLPFVIWVSYSPSFKKTYPFCQQIKDDLLLFIIFEFFYFLQFIGLEYFFRGYVLYSLEERFGKFAIFLMCVPYCMIHFHKPMPEALAAIGAGVILGYVALKTRSIWSGVAIHYLVAVSMDISAIFQHGGFKF